MLVFFPETRLAASIVIFPQPGLKGQSAKEVCNYSKNKVLLFEIMKYG